MFTFDSVHACIEEGKSMTDYHLRLQRSERKRLSREIIDLEQIENKEIILVEH